MIWSSTREDGRHEIYLTTPGSSSVQRLTRTGGRIPLWSPDGKWIAYEKEPEGSIHVMRPDGSEAHQVCAGEPLSDGVPHFWMQDGSGLVCRDKVNIGGVTTVCWSLTSADGGSRKRLFCANEFAQLENGPIEPGGISHDGRWLVGWVYGLYRNGKKGTNGYFQAGHSSVALDLKDKSAIYWIGAGCLTALPPDGDLVYHVSREGDTAPDIYRLRLTDLMTRSSYAMEFGGIPDAEWGHEYMPRISNDNRWMVYAASQGCHDWYECDYEIFLHRLGAGTSERTRITTNPANDNFPDIYIDPPQGRDGMGGPIDSGPVEASTGLDRGTKSGGCGCEVAGRGGGRPAVFLLALPLVIGLFLRSRPRRLAQVKSR